MFGVSPKNSQKSNTDVHSSIGREGVGSPRLEKRGNGGEEEGEGIGFLSWRRLKAGGGGKGNPIQEAGGGKGGESGQGWKAVGWINVPKTRLPIALQGGRARGEEGGGKVPLVPFDFDFGSRISRGEVRTLKLKTKVLDPNQHHFGSFHPSRQKSQRELFMIEVLRGDGGRELERGAAIDTNDRHNAVFNSTMYVHVGMAGKLTLGV